MAPEYDDDAVFRYGEAMTREQYDAKEAEMLAHRASWPPEYVAMQDTIARGMAGASLALRQHIIDDVFAPSALLLGALREKKRLP